jgi:hypothetical protein
MTTRTSKKTVTFKRPFMIGGLDEALPSGDYIVETDEELLEGLSFPAYRRKSTMLYLHQTSRNPSRRQALPINPSELDAALMRDQAADDNPVGASDIRR